MHIIVEMKLTIQVILISIHRTNRRSIITLGILIFQWLRFPFTICAIFTCICTAGYDNAIPVYCIIRFVIRFARICFIIIVYVGLFIILQNRNNRELSRINHDLFPELIRNLSTAVNQARICFGWSRHSRNLANGHAVPDTIMIIFVIVVIICKSRNLSIDIEVVCSGRIALHNRNCLRIMVSIILRFRTLSVGVFDYDRSFFI